jgi:hypothetical protein
MPGLSLQVGGFGGTKAVPQASYGSAASYGSGVTATQAAFGPGTTTPVSSDMSSLSPGNGFGLAFWTGVAALAVLVLVRKSLPN